MRMSSIYWTFGGYCLIFTNFMFEIDYFLLIIWLQLNNIY